MTTEPAISVASLVKTYDGRRVLDGVDLAVPAGSVFGFVGRNGAGKTTTLRILLGLANPTSGSVRVLGHDVRTAGARVRARVGYLPDVPGFYPWMRAAEFLQLCGGLFGLRGADLNERVGSVLDLAGLGGVPQRIGGYSRGMKQRLGIAQALINAPDVLLLDEPTSALDPLGRRDVLAMIQALRGRTTVLFSTHILGDVERVADSAAVIEAGRVVAAGGMGDLTARYGGGRRLVVAVAGGEGDRARLAEAIAGRRWARRVEPVEADGRPALQLSCDDPEAAGRELPGVLDRAGLALTRFEPREASLEEAFVELIGAQP